MSPVRSVALQSATSDSLWLVDRSAAAAQLEAVERACCRLSAADITRAQAMAGASAHHAAIWRVGRIALRIIVERLVIASDGTAAGHRLRCRPFDLTAHGEPSLEGASLVFSQSDVGPYLLVAVAARGRIGVDLELPRRLVMSPARQSRVMVAARSLGSGEPLGLVQAWTRIEAFAKARGPSLARVLTELGLIGVAADSDLQSRAVAVAAVSGLRTHDLDLPNGLMGAVALPRGASVPPLTLFEAAHDPAAPDRPRRRPMQNL